MVNILLEGYAFESEWLYPEIKKHIRPGDKVVVLPFSFRDNRVKSLADWEMLYSPDKGEFYSGIVGSFKAYGIQEEDVVFVNYFSDSKESARAKVEAADVVYFLGGLPDRMMDRLKEFDLLPVLMEHKGVVMGYSAGALIQLKEYHLSPDDDYSTFSYYEGLPFLQDFYVQVHYTGSEVQGESITRVLQESAKAVYALRNQAGGLIVADGQVHCLGRVEIFRRK